MKQNRSVDGTSIMVTGGAGFIGADFVRKADSISKFGKIYVLDSFTYAADMRRLESVSNKVEIIEGDVRDISNFEDVLKDCRYVIHMAAESHVDRSIYGGDTFVSTNVLGSYAILEACRKFPSISLIHVSTDEVYGSIEEGESTETDKLAPSSSYSASKASSDLLALANFRTHGQSVMVTRCTNNFGPFQNSEKFLPTVINSILQDVPIPIYGDGLNQREWIHVSEHNEAILKLMENFEAGQVFNIGSGIRVSNLQLAKDVIELLGASEEMMTFVEDRKGHDFRYALNSSKLRDFTDWEPKINYKKALSETVGWYQSWFKKNKEVYK
jgi:dTDP-glucose 4,6-dehydratase